jgi:hypothetical protein
LDKLIQPLCFLGEVRPTHKYNDQADSTSQALDWMKVRGGRYGLIEYLERLEKTFYFQNLPQKANPKRSHEPQDWAQTQMEPRVLGGFRPRRKIPYQ